MNRLPEFFTRLSPIRETLDAFSAGVAVLERDTAVQNARLSIATADSQGLSLWEADCGLPDGTGTAQEVRRGRIRAALAGGVTLTPAALRQLCRTVGGFDRGEVEEDFAHWAFTLTAVTEGTLPPDPAPLREAVERLKPAHLAARVVPCGQWQGGGVFALVCTGGVLAELSAAAPE